MTKQRVNTLVGSIGAIMGIFVFLAYIPQIIANLNGQQGQPWQPLFAAVSCLIWVVYGWTKEPKKDYILIAPNLAGVVLGFATFLTSL
ncbi:TPA: SemiSWEET family transporter [Streptococcus suis]|uniref:SemiSWEET family transporter n=1 Tax=Streptococcus suis TaxID=1307 RepID=UPI000CF5354E|nr:SemiSWEET family transporter [Streptococcus suis]